MKSFKAFTEMASAKQIRASDILKAEKYQQAEAIINSPRSGLQNQEHLGSGWYSSVYGNDKEALVIKISDSATDGAYYYLELAKEMWDKNSCFPKVAHLSPFKYGSGYIAILEYLNFDPIATMNAWKVEKWWPKSQLYDYGNAYRSLSYWAHEHFFDERNESYEAFAKEVPQMAKLFDVLYRDSETGPLMETNSDIHSGNVACNRRGVPVLVDPIGASYNANYNRNPYHDDNS